MVPMYFPATSLMALLSRGWHAVLVVLKRRLPLPRRCALSFAGCAAVSLSSHCNVCAAGGENGFNQAIELSADTLANVKFVQEKRLISKFFDEISQDTGEPWISPGHW